ncbi:zinc finger protein ZFAT-like isoform X1 [Xyrichtys novacula]|uniref:Zinc finger protein ZFAT-like isoform X1 n=1 Tax=Xyrichtys novacula TaxID=13765 RepID=A0AAV1FKJ9_XYRNO|nr:zinc finger protein ZFAT-like isoform X1 [Xyrichtys novacula]
MYGQKAAGPVFMCRLCNLFSPSHSLLLVHCSQLHPEQKPPDDVIIALQPLAGESAETPSGNPEKRKRGRPKGSKKRTRTELQEDNTDATQSVEDVQDVQRKGAEKKTEGDREYSSKKGESCKELLSLECRNCHRSFGNRRQILKHICLREEEEEEHGDVRSAGGQAEGSESLDPEGVDPNLKPQKPVKQARKRETLNSRPHCNQSQNSKKGGQEAGKSLISVVLVEDETLPGVTKIVPVEDSSAETESTGTQAQPQISSVCEGNPETDQETSSYLTSTTTTTTTTTIKTRTRTSSRGFQEYSIKQDAPSLHQGELKVFVCEFCNKIFKFKHSLVTHLRTHTQEKPFQCPHCDYASSFKANLNIHLRKHTGEKFSCPHCTFTCLSQGHLKVHVERVHLKVKQHCSFCEKKYSDVKNLLKHMERYHNIKDPEVQQSYQQLQLKTRQGLRQFLYHCPTCKRQFKNQLERERHLLIHGPQRPFSCLLCDYAATKMATLAAHVKKHLFLYACFACDGKFVSSHRLKSHLEETHLELDQEVAFTESINSSFCLTQAGGNLGGQEEREDTEEGGTQEHRIELGGEDEKAIEAERENGAEGDGGGEGMRVTARREQEKEKEEEQDKLQGETVQEKQAIGGDREKSRELENRDFQQGLPRQVVSIETGSSINRQDEQEPQDMANSCTPTLGNIKHTVSLTESIHTAAAENSIQENTHTSEENTHTPSSSGITHLSNSSVQTPQEEDAQISHSEKVSKVPHGSAFQQVFSSLQKTLLNMESFHQLRRIYGELECQYCGKLFMYKVHYNVHVRTHTKEHSHYCSKCSYSTITKSSLKRHQIQKHSGVRLICSNPDCEYTTPDKYKLQAHMKTHKDTRKSVTCPVCEHSYPEHRLKYHIKTTHPDSVVQGAGLMAQGAEKCPHCDSCFAKKNSSEFQRHVWAHEGVKPHACSSCDYATWTKSNLRAHVKRHNTDRSHLCDLCGKKFKSKVTLKSHRLSHTDDGKRFQCSECDFISVSKYYLVRHMEQHAEFKPFRCALCHYSCNIAGPLKRHYKLKHPDQKYQNAGLGLPDTEALKQQGGIKCSECEYVYGTKWELNRHMKNKHCVKVVGGTWEVEEAVEAQYVTVEDGEQLTEIPVDALQENVDIQQITEFSSETQEAVTSVVAMTPGTVTVVQQLQVTDEQEDGDCSNQLMVVNADGDLTGDQVMVVEDAHGLEALTVLTQGDNTHHYIVYVQEHTVEIN